MSRTRERQFPPRRIVRIPALILGAAVCNVALSGCEMDTATRVQVGLGMARGAVPLLAAGAAELSPEERAALRAKVVTARDIASTIEAALDDVVVVLDGMEP